jgi:hypothetical protein
VFPVLEAAGAAVVRGATWTTDAPFRETEAVIEGDFEKDEAAGADDALKLIDAIAGCDLAGT